MAKEAASPFLIVDGVVRGGVEKRVAPSTGSFTGEVAGDGRGEVAGEALGDGCGVWRCRKVDVEVENTDERPMLALLLLLLLAGC